MGVLSRDYIGIILRNSYFAQGSFPMMTTPVPPLPVSWYYIEGVILEGGTGRGGGGEGLERSGTDY